MTQLIKNLYDVAMPNSTMCVYLKRWGFSPQRPSKQSYKQKPKQVKKWLDDVNTDGHMIMQWIQMRIKKFGD